MPISFLRSSLTGCLDASQNEVKKKLLEEEKSAITAGMPQLHETGPTTFISMGLIIEESQSVLCIFFGRSIY